MTTKINADSQVRGTLSGRTISANTLASSLCDSAFIEEGNPVTINTGVTLTIDVPFKAGLYQAFNCVGTGAVVFITGMVTEICPDWWTTNTEAKVTDMTAAVKAAVVAAYTTTMYHATKSQPPFPIRVSSMYRLTAPVIIDIAPSPAQYDPLTFKGDLGGGFFVGTAIDMFDTTLVAAPVTSVSSCLVLFDGIVFQTDDSSLDAHVIDPHLFRVHFDHCAFLKMKCLDANGSAITYSQSNRFSHCLINWWEGPFYRASNNFDLHFTGCSVETSAGVAANLEQLVDVVALTGCSFTDNLFEGVLGSVIRSNSFLGVSISGNYFEGNGICVETGAGGAGVVGLTFSGNLIFSNVGAFPCVWKSVVNLVSVGNHCDGDLHSFPAGTPEANVTMNDYSAGTLATPTLVNSLSGSKNLAYSGAITTLTDVPAGTTKTCTITLPATEGVVDLSFSMSETTTPSYGIQKIIIAGYLQTNNSYFNVAEIKRVSSGNITVGAAAAGNGVVTFTIQNASATPVRVRCVYSGSIALSSIAVA